MYGTAHILVLLYPSLDRVFEDLQYGKNWLLFKVIRRALLGFSPHNNQPTKNASLVALGEKGQKRLQRNLGENWLRCSTASKMLMRLAHIHDKGRMEGHHEE